MGEAVLTCHYLSLCNVWIFFFFTWTCVTSNICKLIIKILGVELCPRGVSGLLRLDEGAVKVEEDHRVWLGKVSELGGVYCQPMAAWSQLVTT